jgi:hypothetical protein
MSEKDRRYHEKHRDEINRRKREQRAVNPIPFRESHNRWKANNIDEHRERNAALSRKTNLILRDSAIDRLGGKCVKCGYNENRNAFQIDHINSDGYIERKQAGFTHIRFYKSIIQSGDQGKYQLLCANCNQIKRFENKEHAKRIRK